MNEIAVRTHQGEYYAGETVYGMVYLKVATPNFTEKIQLQINGHEECFYKPEFGDDWTITHPNETLCSPYADKVMANPVEIYAPTEPLPVGSYKFPFQYKLKPGLPCSTSISSPGKNHWHGSVAYTVTALVSQDLSDTQTFVCLGKKEVDFVPVSYQDETTIKKCFCYDRGRISLLVELDKPSYTTDDTMKLSVKVENHTSERAKSIKCWLKRTVKMSGCWIAEDNDDDPYGVYTAQRMVRRQNVVSIDAEEVGYACLGSVTPKENRDWVHKFRLSKPDGTPLPPSTSGPYLKIVYSVVVQASIARASDLIVMFPISGILPARNAEWSEWSCRSWMNQCEIPSRNDTLSVRQAILESAIFEGLP